MGKRKLNEAKHRAVMWSAGVPYGPREAIEIALREEVPAQRAAMRQLGLFQADRPTEHVLGFYCSLSAGSLILIACARHMSRLRSVPGCPGEESQRHRKSEAKTFRAKDQGGAESPQGSRIH